MELSQIIYDYFGFEMLTESSTFIDLLNNFALIGCGLWITLFIIRSLFMVTRIGDSRFI